MHSAQPLGHKATEQICRGRATADFAGRMSLWGLSGEIGGMILSKSNHGCRRKQTGWMVFPMAYRWTASFLGA